MSIADFAAAADAGATIVTPNKRLARHLLTGFDRAQLAAGRRAWVAARAIPWHGWLQSLMQEAMAAGALREPRILIPEHAAVHLWHRIVAQSSPELFNTRGAAIQSAEAWTLFLAWRRPDDTFEAWSRAGIGDAAAAFATWAERYRSELLQRGLLDSAQLADRLAAIAAEVPVWRTRNIVTAGFIELTPQQQRLLGALRNMGATVLDQPLLRVAMARPRRVACATPTAELDAALAWARDLAIANPAADIGIVIDDLTQRRDDVAARAEDILCPEWASRMLPDSPRPYDISLGIPLAEVPLVATALALIALAAGAISAADAAALLRSAYLPDAPAQWSARAAVERRWRKLGARTVTWPDVLLTLGDADPSLAKRWRALTPPARAMQAPSHWASAWRAWLDATGWPGQHALGSGEWQAHEAWSRLLADFGSLAMVVPTLSRDDAVAALRDMAERTVFQPEASPARIRIMGVLEASGLEFDALWIAGLTAERWPPAPQPHPMLPLAWQRERRVPHSEPATELARARALTEGFGAAALSVVASHAKQVDGFASAGSALVAGWPELDAAELPQPAGLARAMSLQTDFVSSCDDDRAPPLTPGSESKGGVGIIESQSNCPFQAFARYRLRTDAWPGVSEGLTAMERGSLLHDALAALWDDVRDHATLCSLDGVELDVRIAKAVAHAQARFDRKRWLSLPPAVAHGEPRRLADTLRAWLNNIERERPPFTVRNTELTAPLALAGVGLQVRIDRVDTLADGGIAVIDYKSGNAIAPGKWFAPRPSGTQIGLYALALLAKERVEAEPQALRAAVYAQLKAGKVGVHGLSADNAAWPAVKPVADLKAVPFSTWPEVEAAWDTQLSALAVDFRLGTAAVAPRDASCCKRCDLQPLCRIQSLADASAAMSAIADE